MPDEITALVTAVQAWAERTNIPVLLVVGAEPPTVLEGGTPAERARMRAVVTGLEKEETHG